MKWFHDLKVTQKLMISYAGILLVMTILGGFAISQLGSVNSASTEIATNWLPSIKTLGDIKLLLARMRSMEAQMALFADQQEAVDTLSKRTDAVLAD